MRTWMHRTNLYVKICPFEKTVFYPRDKHAGTRPFYEANILIKLRACLQRSENDRLSTWKKDDLIWIIYILFVKRSYHRGILGRYQTNFSKIGASRRGSWTLRGYASPNIKSFICRLSQNTGHNVRFEEFMKNPNNLDRVCGPSYNRGLFIVRDGPIGVEFKLARSGDEVHILLGYLSLLRGKCP